MLEAVFTPIEQPQFTQAPREPEWFAKKLLELGGVSPTGLPWLRVVWSGQAQKMLNGARVLAYPDQRQRALIGQNEHNNGRIIFHPADAKETTFQPTSLIIEPVFDWVDSSEHPHWVLEQWTPMEEVISGWDTQKQGPIPTKGVYQILVHISNGGEYAPLNEATWQSVLFCWKRLCASETTNPYLFNTIEQQEQRLKETREHEAIEQQQRDHSRADDIQHVLMQDRRRLHDAFRADFG